LSGAKRPRGTAAAITRTYRRSPTSYLEG
jgi:hypothetical protein